MVLSFKDKETEKVFNQQFSSRLPLGERKMNTIQTPKISDILKEEFMKPLHVSAYKLAHAINVPVSRIQDILHDRRKITIDTSIRLGIFFGVSETYFLNIQNNIDLRNAKEEFKNEFKNIIPLSDSI